MSDNEGLIKDIAKARAWVKQTRRTWEDSKLRAKEAKEIHEGALSSLDELVAELTGEGTRPLFDGPKEDTTLECVDPDNPDCRCPACAAAADDDAGVRLTRWQDTGLSEILPDDPPDGVRNPDIIEKVATHLELPEDQCPTVGGLALIWLAEREQPHTLEDMTSLTEAERETLRQALAEFRRKQGWDARIGLPDGFPLAWIKPQPKADVVIDTMAAAKAKKDKKSA